MPLMLASLVKTISILLFWKKIGFKLTNHFLNPSNSSFRKLIQNFSLLGLSRNSLSFQGKSFRFTSIGQKNIILPLLLQKPEIYSKYNLLYTFLGGKVNRNGEIFYKSFPKKRALSFMTKLALNFVVNITSTTFDLSFVNDTRDKSWVGNVWYFIYS